MTRSIKRFCAEYNRVPVCMARSGAFWNSDISSTSDWELIWKASNTYLSGGFAFIIVLLEYTRIVGEKRLPKARPNFSSQPLCRIIGCWFEVADLRGE